MEKWKLALLGALALPLLAFGITSAAWAVDTRGGEERAGRGVEVAGTPVGGMDRAEVEAVVAELAAAVPGTEVRIDAGDLALETTAGDLGVTLDTEATVRAVMAEGHRDPGPLGPLRWLRSLFAARPVEVDLDIDEAAARAEIVRREGDARTEPVEPTIDPQPDGVRLVEGQPGRGIDTDDVIEQLPGALAEVGEPIELTTERIVTPPTLDDDTIAALARQADENSAGTITVALGEEEAEIDTARLRPNFGLTVGPEGPRLTMNEDNVALALVEAFPPSANPTGVRFALAGGQMVPQPGRDAVICCEEGSARQLVDAIIGGEDRVELAARTLTAAEGVQWAQGLGVREVVGEFTTSHPAGQPRVQNIHRISDLTRGVLIPPGDTFSVNDFVGRRTVEKGFVVAPVIENGEFTDDVGGGVSQYATTLFNAAFFGGLDIPAYKAHSIYISRYPFGREATLAYPGVDLQIANNSPYGVVIWPTYTNSSITVQLWSTRYAAGAQTGQNKSSGCGPIRTTRTRVFVDGRTDQQVYRANYDCDPPSR